MDKEEGEAGPDADDDCGPRLVEVAARAHRHHPCHSDYQLACVFATGCLARRSLIYSVEFNRTILCSRIDCVILSHTKKIVIGALMGTMSF